MSNPWSYLTGIKNNVLKILLCISVCAPFNSETREFDRRMSNDSVNQLYLREAGNLAGRFRRAGLNCSHHVIWAGKGEQVHAAA